jgi:hypothetical protein
MGAFRFLKTLWKNASLGDMAVLLGSPALYSYLFFNSFYRRDVLGIAQPKAFWLFAVVGGTALAIALIGYAILVYRRRG